MGHINTIGSLDRTALSPKAAGAGGVAIGEMACRSMATLSRLGPHAGEAPPPYEWTLSVSVEEVVSAGRTDGGEEEKLGLIYTVSHVVFDLGARSGGASGGEGT